MAIFYNLTTAQCPPVQSVSGMQSLADAKASTSGTANTAANFSPGEKLAFRGKLNQNALSLELTQRYGGSSVYAIAEGLTLSATPSTVTVSAGQAFIGGLVELTAGGTASLSVGVNRVWLKRDKTLSVTLNSVGVPSGGIPACFLGTVEVSGSSTGSLDIDKSGVVVVRGSDRIRETADPGAPPDVPPSHVSLLVRTLGGLYLWDGRQYTRVGGGSGGVGGGGGYSAARWEPVTDGELTDTQLIFQDGDVVMALVAD